MNTGKKLIALIILGLFAVQTFAGFQSSETQHHQPDQAEKVLLQKSLVLSVTPYVENNCKRIPVEGSGFQPWVILPALHKTRIVVPSFEKAVLAGFDLRKSTFLSPVNLIFPFQYFW